MRIQALIVCLITVIGLGKLPAFAQQSERPLKIFGYFQNSFQHRVVDIEPDQNFFNLQQLNLFFQKDLAKNWRAFVNFEFLNNFSSSRQWGAANLEEAWVRYQLNEKFNLKIGLLIPTFNNLNEIKNRTPLLPYIIRPIAYETSFNEFIAVDDYTPARAFAQTYGFLPVGHFKIDYAFYLGNSPNINNNSNTGQTGVDSTDTFLAGGRLGLRYKEWKVGLSATRDNSNDFQLIQGVFRISAAQLVEVPRTRIGGDLSVFQGPLSLHSEFVLFDMSTAGTFNFERNFYYATLGYRMSEELLTYFSFWKVDDKLDIFEVEASTLKLDAATIGLAYNLNDRVIFKGQYAFVKVNATVDTELIDDVGQQVDLNVLSVAASVMF